MDDRCKVFSINIDMFGDMDGLRFFKVCKKKQERKSSGRRRDADFRITGRKKR